MMAAGPAQCMCRYRVCDPGLAVGHKGIMSGMGLDLYVGPLTRYHVGDWLTVAQQAGQELGVPVYTVRISPESEDKVGDPAVVHDVVVNWRAGLATAANLSAEWPEEPELPYWTDKPDWDGYGAVMLLASYDEQPDMRPQGRKGLLGRSKPQDDPWSFSESSAFNKAKISPVRYPSLLAGVEWWLPISGGPSIFQTERPTGHPTLMSSIDQLMGELTTLNARTLKLTPSDVGRALQNGPQPRGSKLEDVAAFGLSVFIALCELAVVHRQPLLMDY